MRLQHILRFFSRSSSRPERPTAAPVVGPVGVSEPASTDIPRTISLDRMALQEAIIHHLEWCVLFNEHLSADAAGETPVTALPTASESVLGQWLDTVKREANEGNNAWLDELIQEHQRFHQLAQQALLLARQGRMDLASTLLNTDFERSRARVLDLLRHVQKR